MSTHSRRPWARAVGAVVGCALLVGVVPALAVTPAAARIKPAATVVPRSAELPTGVSAGTRAAVETARQELARIEAEAAQISADYLTATARLSIARRTAIDAERRAELAQQRADKASRQLGRFASNAYRAGPMAAAAAVLSSHSPSELLHTASMVSLVGANQSVALQQLQQARAVAAEAGVTAQQGREDASAARSDAKRLTELARERLTRAVELLTKLRAKAKREARAAQERRLAAAQSALASGLTAAPAAATAPGPPPGLPGTAGPDPGDGSPGPDHLRPRTERARQIIIERFGVTDIGGWRPSDSVSSDHPNGKALDVMISTGSPLPDLAHVDLGWRIARWAQANAAGLGVTYIIWQARVWSVARSAEGWRDYTVNFPYGSAVNPTTLHLDHVHISFG